MACAHRFVGGSCETGRFSLVLPGVFEVSSTIQKLCVMFSCFPGVLRASCRPVGRGQGQRFAEVFKVSLATKTWAN